MNCGFGYESGAFMDTLAYEDNRVVYAPARDSSCSIYFAFDLNTVEIVPYRSAFKLRLSSRSAGPFDLRKDLVRYSCDPGSIGSQKFCQLNSLPDSPLNGRKGRESYNCGLRWWPNSVYPTVKFQNTFPRSVKVV